MEITKATMDDLESIKKLTDENKDSLGFVIRSSLVKAIESKEIFVVREKTVIGFLNYHHRRDNQSTVYQIVVDKAHRMNGIGKILMESLIVEAIERNKKFILLKCPKDLSSNIFYQKIGFSLFGIMAGKRRDLILWKIDLNNIDS